MQNENMVFLQDRSRISTNSDVTHTHMIKLWEDIGPPSDYQEEIDLIDNARPEDTIVVDLCTDGGMMDTAALFNRALRNSAAHTVAIIGPSCSSAGSIIALSCKEFVIDSTSSLMLHTSSYGFGQSKDVDIFEHATFSRKSLRRLYEEVYSGFISQDQLEDVIKGQPFYFDCEELEKCLTDLYHYRQGQQEDCSCGECPDEWGDEIVSYKNEEPYEDEGQIVELLDCRVKDWQDWDEEVEENFLYLSVTKEVYDKIYGKSIQIVVDSDEEGGA